MQYSVWTWIIKQAGGIACLTFILGGVSIILLSRTVGVSFATVFILDNGFHVYVWVGKEATSHEKGSGLTLAHVRTFSNFRHSFIVLFYSDAVVAPIFLFRLFQTFRFLSLLKCVRKFLVIVP